ncbi:MAG TPA: winged helix-turn-helix domain-containing protein [Pseudonocardiaceae bacterium]|nr:winged helix-turn-helix domain-containing protein [Pseudonocardiaceae bacterium]
MGNLDPDDPRPPYRQVADALRLAIESGEYKPGDRLPPIPALTSEYGVSTGTAKSALTVLRDDGLIVTRQGKGSYVRTEKAPADDRRADLATRLQDIEAEVRDLRHRLETLEASR